jgi:C6 transcription factor Pro1
MSTPNGKTRLPRKIHHPDAGLANFAAINANFAQNAEPARACKSLQIACCFDSRKPEWMTSRKTQRVMMDKIKYQIKQHTAHCRARNQASVCKPSGENGACIVRFESDVKGQTDLRTVNLDGVSVHNVTSPTYEPWEQNAKVHGQGFQSSHRINERCDFKHYSTNTHMCSNSFSQATSHKIDFIMKYLDYVFPVLFPFCRPAIFVTGRSWLLSLLTRNRIAFHSALSLTSYFFTLALGDGYGDTYADCTSKGWSFLEEQTERCFETMRTVMLELNVLDNTATVLDKVQAMESIIQILMFEVVLGRLAKSNTHLNAAIALFEQVFNAKGQQQSLVSALHSISRPIWYKVEYTHYIWNPDQAGFRFFACLLIFINVIASTALAQPPRLGAHHVNLLADKDDTAPILGFNRLRLSTVVGCQNSVIVAICQISALFAWKQSMKRTESLAAEIVRLAAPISGSLNSALAALDCSSALERQQPQTLPFESYAVRSRALGATVTATRIWTHASKIYLAVVVSGRLVDAEIQGGVSCILKLLEAVPCNHLRTLAWPICFARCFAPVSQEEEFRDIFRAKKEIELVGSLKEACQVMEKVWQIRQTQESETVDLAACLI